MEFLPNRISYEDGSERSAVIYLPGSDQAGDIPSLDGEFAEVKVDGKVRKMSSKVLSMLIEFGLDDAERDRRAGLKHDCYTFAMAYYTGDSLANLSFCKPRDFKSSWQYKDPVDAELISDHLNDQVGDVIYTGLVRPTSLYWINPHISNCHYVVRATPSEDNDPLYVSKLGIHGPVAVHRMDEILKLFPAKLAGIAHGFEIKR